jgi:hypothetical protein
VLKLIYHTHVFGPIDFEYDRPSVRVGSDPANDLVLSHPSVSAFHCVLVFQDEKVIWLRPEACELSEPDLLAMTGQEFAAGDRFLVGELEFQLDHSSRSVALHRHQAFQEDAQQTENCRHFCPNCRRFIPEQDVKRVGLVGQPKRELCPQCSRLLEVVIRS